ncbi:MAG: hypothetical protein FWE83_07315 [Oscillospiraceae bacterium]|nr:hypothetical protein [Oscillospiraceae bacterium]
MKRILILFLVITAMLVIAACGDAQGVDTPETPGSSSQNGEDSSNPDTGTDPGTPGNSDENGNGNGIDSNSNGDPQIPAAFSFTFNDVVIAMDDDVDYIISKLGEPRGDITVPSCAFEGLNDRIVEYPGIRITAYPIGEQHYIFNVSFFDDSVRTAEGGIRLGATIQAVFDAYGEDHSYETGMYRFARGLTYLEFLTEDDIVIGITYRLDLGL